MVHSWRHITNTQWTKNVTAEQFSAADMVGYYGVWSVYVKGNRRNSYIIFWSKSKLKDQKQRRRKTPHTGNTESLDPEHFSYLIFFEFGEEEENLE